MFRAHRVALQILVVVAMVFGSIGVGTPFANAEDPSFFLNSVDIGAGIETTLRAADGRTTLTVPVPVGTRPVSYAATAVLPPGLQRGWIDVTAGERLVARIEIPEGATIVPFTVPLDGILPAASDQAVVLAISSTMLPLDRICYEEPVEATLTLRDQFFGYAGDPEVPRSIADFLPPVLQQFTIFLPDEPNTDQSGAAVALAAAVVHYYDAQPVRVVLRSDRELTGAPLDGPFERSAVIRDNSDGNTELIYPDEPAPPRVFVTGSGSALLDQVRLITSNVSQLAVTTSALSGPNAPRPVLTADSMTLADMSIRGVTGSGIARAAVTVPVDQTRLGRSGRALRVHLIGAYAPQAGNAGGTLSVSVGDRLLESWPAESSGVLDRWITLPADVLGRVTNLDVAYIVGGERDCGRGQAVTLTVDQSTVVESSGSGVPEPPGFDSLPQALLPQVPVALTEQDFANTARAVALVTGLQRMSAGPLAPEVVSIVDLIEGRDSGIVVAPDGDVPESVKLPLRGNESFSLTFTDPELQIDDVVTLRDELRYGSLQVAYDAAKNRTLLVATSQGAAGELDRGLDWLSADLRRWYALRGDVLFIAPGRDPVTLQAAAAQFADPAPASKSSSVSLGVVAAAAAGLIVVAGIVFFLVRRRRRA